MILLELRFPAGRYHATPWGRHVNEGAVEWPPSPWRVLRCLIATRHLKARTEVPEDHLARLIHALASQQPSFRFPRATTGHTRHYMPYIEGSKEKTTKIFDTFIQLPKDDPLTIAWDIDLPEDQFRDLQLLAERMGYFGRAESLVLAAASTSHDTFNPDARPLAAGTLMPQGSETVRLLAPLPEPAYQQWKTGYLAGLAAALPAATGKGKPSKAARLPDLPSDVFAALHADTGDLQDAGWNVPPGSVWVTYASADDAFAPQPAPRRAQALKDLPTVARYAITSKVPPSILDAVSVADRTHKSLCAWSDKGSGRGSVFTGQDEHKQPFKDHRHAHTFCEANATRGEVTHLTVWAPMGFDDDARLALRQLNKVWGSEGHEVRLILEALGQEKDFAEVPLFKPSRHWRSLTPFISTRHAKTTRPGLQKMDATGQWQIGSDAHDLARLLSLDPRCSGAVIQPVESPTPLQAGGRQFRALQFQTIRHRGGGSRGIGSGSAFSITFPESVSGPLAFGYGSHFGLGLFVPAGPS